MKVVAAGDSFIYGVDLHDCDRSPSQLTWPALLSNEYVCIAKPGTANDAITRAVIDYCENNKPDFVIVQWTFPWRFSLRFVDPIKWYEFDLNVTKDSEYESTPQLIKPFLKEFYKTAGTTEYWPVYTTLKEILLLQNYLKSEHIPYLFTAAHNVIFNSHSVNFDCLLYTSPSPRDRTRSRMPSSA